MAKKTVLTIAEITCDKSAFIISQFNGHVFKQYLYGNTFLKKEIEEKFMPIIKDADHIDELRLLVPCHEYTVLVKNKQEIARNKKINPSKIENYLCKINNITKEEIQFSYSEPTELKEVVIILYVNKKAYLNMKELYYKKFKAKMYMEK